ncbi:hypothetical protein [Nocardia callitridis]|uniref:MarR family transcriptional regulator n=1 Tax=Nocardia callitridis TaxID=648753 RepID=A0ABP9KQ41_9NOCA
MSHDLSILQAARLKGRPSEADLTAAACLTEAETAEALAVVRSLIAAGELDRAGARLQLNAAGRARLDSLLTVERTTVDRRLLRKQYRDFGEINTAFKQLVTDWQLIDGTQPNDHHDPEYDAHIVRQLAELHRRFAPLLEQFVRLVPRLAAYQRRFVRALDHVESGDHAWLARPLIDSYHTVWFELHEELIGLAGLSRMREARTERAQ